MSTLFCAVMLACMAAGIVLGMPRRRRPPPGVLVAELGMLAAMTDVCLLGGMLLPPVAWSAVLVLAVVALSPALRRRGRAEARAAVHLLGIVMGAALLLLAGDDGHVGLAGAHRGAPVRLLVPFAGPRGTRSAVRRAGAGALAVLDRGGPGPQRGRGHRRHGRDAHGRRLTRGWRMRPPVTCRKHAYDTIGSNLPGIGCRFAQETPRRHEEAAC